MENNNLTVWQRLSHAFGPNAMLNQDVPTYKFDKKELLRTQDKNDFERQRLQAQQTFYLSNQWSKIDNHLYTQAIYYEPSRLASVYDFEAMEYSLFAETKIATPDGFYTIKELADKGRDYEFITYAYDHNLKKVVPAKAYNAHYTRDEMTYKITFDDNSHIIATYGHRFLKRDGVFCEVENLQVGDSMMPFYRKSFYNNQNYNWIYTCNNNEGHHGWVKEDVLMAELNPKELNERTFMASKIIPWDLLVETAKKEKSMRNVSIVLGISIYELDSKIQVGGFNDWATFMEAYGLDVPNEKIEQKESNEVLVNHKIISIEPYGVVPVYDLTVPGYKNFATDTIFSHNTPEIGAALDIYAEESTTTDENGFMLQIYSESKRIKSVLTDLFNNVLDINTNLPMWTRNTVKFGDNFIYLKLDPEKGIVGCNQLPNIEIERLEPGGEDKTVSQSTNKVINDSLKFRWKNKTMEFQPWEVAHFRILGDDRKLPYGTCLKYDSKIDTEFGVKEIKDVQKGDLVWSFDLNTEQKVLSKVLDTVNSGIKTCYQIHTKHNFIEASKEHKILIYKNNEFIYKNVLDLEIGECLVIDNTKGQVKEIEINKSKPNNKRKSEDYILEPINKIIEIGEFETYDIYVENENHNFYANGVVVHNSMLEKARRIWKQLLLAEDAMLIYRTSRAPERRVFKVFVGNMDDNDVEAYVNRVANKFKREQVVDSKTGNVDMRYNQMAVDQDYFVPVRDPSAPSPIETLPGACVSLDTRIPLLDGRVLELNKIIEEWDNGNRNLWAYSCDPTTGDLAPGLITWAGVTRKNTNVLKITLDNGEQVITTPDHKFVHRTNGFVEAQNLKVGDSLMPFYTRESKINSSKSKYHQVWNNKTKKWSFTHRMVANFMKDMNQHTEFVYNDKLVLEDKRTIHHLDIDRYNNTPNNLTFMNNKDHYEYHSNNINIEHCRLGGQALKNKLIANPELKETLINMQRISSKEMWSKRTKDEIEIISKKQSNGLKKYIQSINEDEKNYRYSKNIHSPEAKTKTLTKLLAWCENVENRKKKGLLISKTKQLHENKEKASELAKKNWESVSYRDKVFSKPQKLIFNDLLFNIFVDTTKKFNTVNKVLNSLNNNSIFMLEFYNLNKNIRSSLVNLTVFTENNLNKLLKQFGYLNWKSWKSRSLNNHKITSIEILGEKTDTGTITIDGNEIYHNYHTFAIESGIFIKNSNLGDIADIEYIQKKLVTALRIPKSFLGFEEVVGDGKTLSIQDIRFARTINRIQKCMLAELNKIAIVHLFLLGFEDEISNFTLGLTNPSVQSDLLKIDVWKEKIMLYRDAVSDPGSGVAAVSATWAKKHIFGFSDEEIRLDLQQQRIERAVGQELLNTALVIKKTGLFDNIDKLYGDVSGSTTGENATATPGDTGSGSMSSGGLDMGGLDMGGLDMGGEESAEGAPPPPPPLPNEAPGEPTLAAESKLNNLNILVESNMIDGASYIPLTKGQNSLGVINDELKKLLNL